jgi:SNF2 family DNA or RNA helicase
MLQQKGSEWTLRPPKLTAEDLIAIQSIPGLRINGSTIGGLIDAVAAACLRLKLPLPVKPTRPPLENPQLFPFQRDGVARLLEITGRSGGALLCDDVGLGKTRQALAFTEQKKGRTLIVCPAYVRSSWADEIRKLQPAAIIAVRDVLTTKAKKEAWERDRTRASYVITSYELADTASQEAFTFNLPTTLVMDEAHYLCGRQSKRSKRLRELSAMVPYKLALTATPAWNRPRDFYSLLKVLLGSRFGTPSDFDFSYCAGQINEFGGMVNKGVSNADELRLRLSFYMVRREKKEVLKELPALTRQVVWVDADKKASAEFLRLQGLSSLDKPNVSKALEATHEGKLSTAVELAVQARQFLLFTYRKSHAHVLHQRIEAEGVPCVVITGDINTDERARLCKYAAENQVGVVATIDSAGAGLNLQGITHYGIMHAIDWLPNKMHQAEGRIHRIGQTHGVNWVYLAMRDSADEMVVRSVVDKMDSLHAILGGTKEMRHDLSDAMNESPETEAALMAAMYADL